MGAGKTIDRTDLQALKITEIRGSVTNFNLYLDLGGEIIPYALGRHLWSSDERNELVERGQFILLYEKVDEAEVRSYLSQDLEMSDGSSIPNSDLEAMLVPDGMAEFLKTRYRLPFNPEQYTFFKGLALAMAQYLKSQSILHRHLQTLARHDTYTFYHSCRVSAFAVGLCIDIFGEDHARLWDVAMGSLLHDIGYLTVPKSILDREGPLEDKEWTLVRRHPEEGLRLLQNVNLNPIVREIILHHHERWDGGGYPHKLASKELPLEVRIVSFAEVFAALTTPRAYQKQKSSLEALAMIEGGLMSFLDPSLLKVLKGLLGIVPRREPALKDSVS